VAAPGLESRAAELSFLDDLKSYAVATPDAAALIEPNGTRLTFAGLHTRIEAIGRAVTCSGIGRNDVAALVLPDGVDLIATFLGVASVAGCAVLNPALQPAEIESALADFEARAVIVEHKLSSPAGDVARRLGMSVLDVTSPTPGTAPAAEPASGSQVALLLQTSATTGKARIVPLTHSNLRAQAASTRGILGLTPADRFLSMMPLFHLQGLLSSVAQLSSGGSVICTAGFDANAFLTWLEEYRPTWYTAGPTLHHAILPLLDSHPEILERSPLRFVRSIGAPLAHALMEQLERTLHAPVLEGYGLTEAGAITSNTSNRRKAGSAGRSTGPEIGIMGATGEVLGPDCDGEIVVRGPAVIGSYRNNPEANRTAFHDGWLRTGDLGRLDADGFLFVTGRIKEIINRGGEKILPGEVEGALMAHPAVAEAVAFGVPHPTLGEDVMAAVVLRPDVPVSEGALRHFASERIAGFKLPRRIIFLTAIPKGATGKPARAALVQQLEAEDSVQETRGPATEVEKSLATTWQRILKIESVDIRDDFFQLGGDSLALTLMMAEVEREFGSEDRAEFLSSPTIETLAHIVARTPEKRSQRSSFLTLNPDGSRTPFFCIPGGDENPYYLLDLAKGLGADQPVFIVRDPRPIQDRGVYTLEEHAAHLCAAIRSKLPEGPYSLGGHCYGGVLAFEVARQLVAAGKEVSILVLFEVPTPGYPKVVRHWKNYLKQSAALVSSLRRGPRDVVLAQVRSHAELLTNLFRKKARSLVNRALVSAGMRAVMEPAGQISLRNVRAGRAYVPRKLNCDVVHFLAAEERHDTLILDDPRLGWGELTGSGFSTRKVPGIADGIFKPPYVKELASQLRSCLDLADSRPKSSGVLQP